MSKEILTSVRSKSCDKCGVRFVATENQGLCKKCNREEVQAAFDREMNALKKEATGE